MATPACDKNDQCDKTEAILLSGEHTIALYDEKAKHAHDAILWHMVKRWPRRDELAVRQRVG